MPDNSRLHLTSCNAYSANNVMVELHNVVVFLLETVIQLVIHLPFSSNLFVLNTINSFRHSTNCLIHVCKQHIVMIMIR